MVQVEVTTFFGLKLLNGRGDANNHKCVGSDVFATPSISKLNQLYVRDSELEQRSLTADFHQLVLTR
jgi:hypothetical protein